MFVSSCLASHETSAALLHGVAFMLLQSQLATLTASPAAVCLPDLQCPHGCSAEVQDVLRTAGRIQGRPAAQQLRPAEPARVRRGGDPCGGDGAAPADRGQRGAARPGRRHLLPHMPQHRVRRAASHIGLIGPDATSLPCCAGLQMVRSPGRAFCRSKAQACSVVLCTCTRL